MAKSETKSKVSPVIAARRAIFFSDLDTKAKFVLMALLEHWSPGGMICPGIKRLMLFTGFSDGAVRSGLRTLEAAGFVVTRRRRGHGNHYDLTEWFQYSTSKQAAAAQKLKLSTLKDSTVKSEREGASLGDVPSASSGDVVKNQVRHQVTVGASSGDGGVRHQVTPKRSIEEIQLREPMSGTSENRTTELKDFYLKTYKEARRCQPDWSQRDWPKHMKAFKQLGEAFNGDLSKQQQVIRAAMLDEFSPQVEPMVIYKNRNQYAGREPRRKGPSLRHATPQKGLDSSVTFGDGSDWEDQPKAPTAQADAPKLGWGR